MKSLRSIATSISVIGSPFIVWIVASCATQGDELRPAALLDDASAPDTSTVIEGPDAAELQVCTDGRWCAVKLPLAEPTALTGIWGTGPSDIWLVGSPDIAIHFDGTSFTSTHLKTTQTVFGIWGASPTDLWAFSTGDAIWHNGGTVQPPGAWSAAEKQDAGADPPPWNSPIYSMWGRDAHDVWAVGPYTGGQTLSTVWHSAGWNDGNPGWVASTTTPGAEPWEIEPSFNAVWGSPSGEIWVVGERGKTRYSSGWKDGGATWTIVDSGTSLTLDAVWGTGSGDVWAAGSGGVMRRFTRRQDGKVVAEAVDFPSRATIHAIKGLSATDIWAAGSEGTLAHWDGAAWSLVDLGDAVLAPGGPKELLAVWPAGPNDVWAAGRNVLLHKGPTLLPGTTRP